MNEEIKNLSAHIDDPIKKCIVGLNLLGIKTAMSCCGFNYKGEKVPKQHLEKAYVYIDCVKTPEIKYIDLVKLSRLSGWKISPLTYNNNPFLDFFSERWPDNHPWNKKDCPHYHEQFVIGIHQLEAALVYAESVMADQVEIVDGNSMYQELFKIKYWQYEPAEPWIVTKEMYKSL